MSFPAYNNSPERVIYPMKRDPKFRGDNSKWERISWDEAYDMIEKETRRIQKEYGPESIMTFIGTGRDVWHTVPKITFSAFESPNFNYPHNGWSCYGPRSSICVYVLGAGYPESTTPPSSPRSATTIRTTCCPRWRSSSARTRWCPTPTVCSAMRSLT